MDKFLLHENVSSFLGNLKTNLLRTCLTLLGITIGVIAVIATGTIASIGRTIIFNELETFGLNSIWVYRSSTQEKPGESYKKGTGLKISDLEVIRENIHAVGDVTPVSSRTAWVKNQNKFTKINLLGTDGNYAVINNDSMVEGRFLVPEDLYLGQKVCVIGPEVSRKLFSTASPLGQEIEIENHAYKVIGLLREKGRDFLSAIGAGDGQDSNQRIIIPLNVWQSQFNNDDIDFIQAQAKTLDQVEEASSQILNLLHFIKKGQFTYQAETMKQYIETADRILDTVSWIGALTALISLVVGGVGIMNIMISSVMERTREIGIRKAVGATNTDILFQFVTESAMISLLGGLAGCFLGTLVVLSVEFLIDKPLAVSWPHVFLALFVSALVGILSGYYPARRASRLDPVVALRHD